jgi:hypothetical protein
MTEAEARRYAEERGWVLQKLCKSYRITAADGTLIAADGTRIAADWTDPDGYGSRSPTSVGCWRPRSFWWAGLLPLTPPVS